MPTTLNFIPIKSLVFLPEAYLAITLFITLFYGLFHKYSLESGSEIKFLNRFFYVGISLIIFVLFLVVAISIFSLESIKGYFKVTNLIFIIKSTILVCTILIILVSKEYLLSCFTFNSEYIIILFFSILGLSLLTSANDFLSMFIAIEFSSLPFYLLGINKKYTVKHNNSVLNYFILSLISSGIMLYGISFIYGFTGSTNFSYIASYLDVNSNPNILLIFAILLIIVGVSFKIALAPFHMWILDVYSGLNYALVLFLNTVFKLAFFFILLKVLWGPFYGFLESWLYIIYILSFVSILIGYIGAIFQNNIMKIIAYSSVSQMGLAAIFLLSKNNVSIIGLILFFIIYIISNIGIFGILMWCELNYKKLVTLNDLKGFSAKNPFYAFMLAVFFLSLAGVPPLGGFFAKLFVIYSAITESYYILGISAIIISILGMFFYIRVVRYIYMEIDPSNEEKIKKTRFVSICNLVILLCFIFILLFIIFLIPINNLVEGLKLLHV